MFYKNLVSEIIKNYRNNVVSNIDYNRYPEGLKNSVLKNIKLHFLSLFPPSFIERNCEQKLFKKILISPLSIYLNDIEDLYNSLYDFDSKNNLIQILAYKILRHTKVKLDYNNEDYKSTMKDLIQYYNRYKNEDFINIKKYGYDLNVKLPYKAVYDTFIYRHYDFKGIKPLPGEVVLDLGGWKGDTAMYFSSIVGQEGKVYSFEFMPENLVYLYEHIRANDLKNIQVIEKPVWHITGEKVYIKGSGAGARIVENNINGSIQLETITIDDFIKQEQLNSVDFIKMDIEGSEPYALKGGIETIKKYKPKLAISIYHNMNDFTNIHRIIKQIDPSYKLYLNHCSIYDEETVIFAKI